MTDQKIKFALPTFNVILVAASVPRGHCDLRWPRPPKTLAKRKESYSTDIQFLHQSIGRLPVLGCSNTHGKHVKMANVACKSKLRSMVRSSMHPWPGNRVAIVRAVEFYEFYGCLRIECRNYMPAL